MNNEELVLLYQQGDQDALTTLIKNNTGIINKLAFKYGKCNKLIDEDDLKQSGCIGLINAANRYDFELENRSNFITFAFYHIDREMQVCLNGRTSKDINNTKFYKSVTSLNVPIGENEGSDLELIDTVDSHSNDMENVEDILYFKQLRNELQGAMIDYNTLREREVLELHYGWNIEPIVLSEIGGLLQLSFEKVRSIEYMALRKLFNSRWGRTKGRQYIKEIICSDNFGYKEVEKKLDLDRYFEEIDMKTENVFNF